jgi:hypothetical protein
MSYDFLRFSHSSAPGRFRGQALSFDFLIACSIFLIMVGILLAKVGYEMKDAQEVNSKNAIISEADTISGIFFQEGIPKDWTNETVQVIGLRSGGRISAQKLQEFSNIPYFRSISLLGIKNGYNITVSGSSGELFSFGSSYEGAKSLIKADRIGVLENGTIVTISSYIFEK